MGKRIKIAIKVLDWIIFLGLFGVALYFTVDAIEIYNLKRTAMSQSFEPITRLPTIVICWDSKYHLVYKNHFSIWHYSTYHEDNYKLLELDELKTYKSNQTKETVLLQQAHLSCFKISSKLEMPPKPEDSRWIKVAFKYWIDPSIVEGIDIYIMDEADSYAYGVYHYWYDGKPVKVRTSLGQRYYHHLTFESHEYLDDDDQCSHLSSIHQKRQFIKNANFSLLSCPKKCSPYLLPFQDLPICGFTDSDLEASVCASTILSIAHADSANNGTYKRPCKINQYIGENVVAEDNSYSSTM